MRLSTLAFALALATPAAAFAQDTGSLTLSFPDLPQKTGLVMVAVYDGPEGWALGKPAKVAIAPAAEPIARLEGLKPGTYAVRAFHDVDGDGKMGTNPFGLPTEPYGFSNGAKANMGPPTFEAAGFAVTAGTNAQSVVLK